MKYSIFLILGFVATVYGEEAAKDAYTFELTADEVIIHSEFGSVNYQGQNIPILRSTDVEYINLKKIHTATYGGKTLTFAPPVFENFGSEIAIALSPTSGRLIMSAGEKLGNIGAELGEYNYNKESRVLSFDKQSTEKAFGDLYGYAIFESLKDLYKVSELAMCAGADFASGLTCTPKTEDGLFECRIEKFRFTLTSLCDGIPEEGMTPQ